jgi:hypothetical protein
MKSGTTRLINRVEVMKKSIAFTFCAVLAGSVLAALPALTPEAQEAASLVKAKTAYGDKVGAYKLCLAQNKVADEYRAAGTPAPATCVAPPPFVAPDATVAPTTPMPLTK